MWRVPDWRTVFLFLMWLCVTACNKSPTTQSVASATNAPPVEIASHVVAEGRLVTYPNAEAVISAEQKGVIVTLPVKEKSQLHKGDLIAEIKADDIRAALNEARAIVTEAQANLRLAEAEVTRVEMLLKQHLISEQQRDRTLRDHETAVARLNTAQASVHRMEALLAKSRITAPIDGVVISRTVNLGEAVDVGTPVVTVANLDRTRIEAEVDEFDANRVRVGSDVKVTAEGFPGLTWRGKVEEIPDVVTGRRLKPQDPGRPTDTRVLLVKISLDESTPLKLGQRVEVAIQGNDQQKRSASKN